MPTQTPTPPTRVRIDLRTADGAPVTGVLHWTPTRRLVADDHVVLPAAVSTALRGEPAVAEVIPTDSQEYDAGRWCWRVDEYVRGGDGTTRHVLIPTVHGDLTLEYAALIDIDPASLQPAAQPQPLWQVQLDSVARRVEQLAETGTTVDLSNYVTDAELAAALVGLGSGGGSGSAGGSLFDGTGAPPSVIFGARVGDYYLDKASGQLWKLGS